MTQVLDLDAVIRARVRSLRVAHGWSLDALAGRSEPGPRPIAVDQQARIARALGTSLDQLVDLTSDEDVVIQPRRDSARGRTTWLLTRDDEPQGLVVAKMRITAR